MFHQAALTFILLKKKLLKSMIPWTWLLELFFSWWIFFINILKNMFFCVFTYIWLVGYCFIYTYKFRREIYLTFLHFFVTFCYDYADFKSHFGSISFSEFTGRDFSTDFYSMLKCLQEFNRDLPLLCRKMLVMCSIFK